MHQAQDDVLREDGNRNHSTFRAASLAIAFVALIFLPLFLQGGILDDAYIFCRYAENLLSGNGLVFNPGERVEGITSFLHTIVVSVGMAAGFDAALAARGASVSAGLFVLVLLVCCRFENPLVGPSAALLTAFSAPFFMWSSSGMDQTLFAAATLLAVIVAGRDLDDPRRGGQLSLPTWLLVGMPYLVRPEGLVVTGTITLFALPGLLRAGRQPKAWLGPSLALLPVLALTTFRLLYYGYPVPNTYYAKVSGGSWHLIVRGLMYAGNTLVVLGPLVVLVAVGWKRLRRNPTAFLAVSVSFLLLLAAILSGGDAFPLARFAVPAVPLLAVVVASGLQKLTTSLRTFTVAASSLAVLILGWTINAPVPFQLGYSGFGVQGYGFLRAQTATWDQIGRDLPRKLGPNRLIALSPIGAIPFRSGWRTVDMLGLVDLHISHLDVELGQGIAGHEKYDGSYILSRQPDVVLFHNMLWHTPVDPAHAIEMLMGLDPKVALVEDPSFQAHYRPIWLEVTQGYVLLFLRS
jgi:hypothetical protein